jgi:hypothetical protein
MKECPVLSAYNFLWIENVLRVERLSDQTRSASPRNDGDVVFSAHEDNMPYILNVFGGYNSNGHHFDHARCGAVLCSLFNVEPTVTRKLAA